MSPTLIYCYDAYCGWCYGFSPVIRRVAEELGDRIPIEVLSGGMVMPETPRHISVTAGYILQAYPRVEELTGVRFGEDYLWHLKNPDLSDWYPDSLKPAIALSILREQHPDQAVFFASDLQYALYMEGRDLTDDEAYRHLLPKYGLDADTFYAALKSPEYEEKARYDFALCQQLQATGFPTVLMQMSETKFYLIARGYTDYETLMQRIQAVMQESA